jgi:hypothetical protein
MNLFEKLIFFKEQRRRENSTIVQASYDGLVKPLQTKFDGI